MIFERGTCDHKIQIRYLTGTWGERGYVAPMLDLVEKIHVREPSEKHILLFLTGQDEIDRVCKVLSNRCPFPPPFSVRFASEV